MKSLNFKIVRLVGGLLIFTSIAIMLAVAGALNKHAESQVLKNMQLGGKVLKQIILDREQQLVNSAKVLAADFGFKQAVATGDTATMESVLTNHGKRIDASLMVLFNLKNELLAFSETRHSMQSESLDIPQIQNLKSGESIIFELRGFFYQCILVEVTAPLPVAKALIGFELDQSFVENLKAITNLDVTLLSSEDANLAVEKKNIKYAITTLKQTAGNLNDALANQQSNNTSFLLLSNQEFVTSFQLLDEYKNIRIWISLTENIGHLFKGFQHLQINIGLIAIAALLLTLFFGALFSRNLSIQLSKFVESTQKIAKGDYQYPIVSNNNIKEVNQLSKAIVSMRNQISERQKEIEYRATHDQLTHLINRSEVEKIIDAEMINESKLMLVGIKLENLESIDLAFGHDVGDAYLQSISKRIMKFDGDSAYMGAGIFMLVSRHILAIEQLVKLKSKLEETYRLLGTKIDAKLAIGTIECASVDESGLSYIRKLSLAIAASEAKHGSIQFYHEAMEKEFKWRVDVLHRLEQVLSEPTQELKVHYQPKVQFSSESQPKLEALLRWQSESLGFVSPEDFIPIAEASGLINKLTLQVINMVVRDIKTWREQGVEITVAINLSANDVVDERLLNIVEKIIFSEGLTKDSLSFEITEGELVDKGSTAIEVLEKFRSHGYALSIDDFGTGYSSLAYLKNMPVSEIKIDKSFVLNLERDLNDQKIVKAIISLAKNFNFKTVAEGVETKAALTLLQDWDCDWIQGYYISKPMPPELVVNWVKAFTIKEFIS